MRWRLVRHGLAGVVVLLLLAGCATSDEHAALEAAREPLVVSSHLSDAQQKFLAGDFGLAERSYRAAVEENSNDVDAWLGLAACYDELRRFDLADQAYGEVLKRVGETPEVLNNIGYSYLLRGDLTKAQAKIAAAYERDPGNPTIRANVDKLNERLAKSGGPTLAVR
jgi:Tfp pilus assembly protein PilF